MTEYIIDFGSVILEALSEKEAYEKAKDLIENKEVTICNIEIN